MKKRDDKKIENAYFYRINKVIDYINKNISDNLSLELLSQIGMFSKFHFHRVFRTYVGETLNEYINRLRLEKSIIRIINSRADSITDIALDLGFSSSANFTRKFKEHYRFSPSEIRKNNGLFYNNFSFDRINSTEKTIDRKINVTVQKMPALHVAYYRVFNGYNSEKIYSHFEKLIKWSQRNQIFSINTAMLGIIHDDPYVTAHHKCRYDTAITIPEEITHFENINITDIDGGYYAIYKFEGKRDEIPYAWDNLYKFWLPRSGYLPDYKPAIDYFLENTPAESKNIITVNLNFPVKKAIFEK